MYRLPSDINVAQAVVDTRFYGFWRDSGFLTLGRLARSLKGKEQKYRGSYMLLSSSDLAYLGQLGVFGDRSSLPSLIPLLPLIGRWRLRRIQKLGLGLQLIYDRDPEVINGLFIALAEDL